VDAPAPCCALAARSDAAELEADLRGGVALRAIVRARGVPYTALRTHRGHVLPDAPGTAPIRPESASNRGPESAESTAKQGQPAARTVLVAARRLERRASRLLRGVEQGEQGIDYRAAAALVGQVRGAIELEARLLGEIRSANAEVNVYQSPGWLELRDRLMGALAPHPAALEAVLAAIRSGERGEPAPAPAAASVGAAALARRDASFGAAWEGVRLVLEARYPGAAETVEAELAAWEEQGDAWRARWGASAPGVEHRFIVELTTPERPGVAPGVAHLDGL